MIATLIQQISNRLIIIGGEDNGIKHVDEYMGPTYFEKNVAVAFPCAFVQIMPISWQDGTQNTQVADVQVKIHVLSKQTANTYINKRNQPDNDRFKAQKALDFYDLAGHVHHWLQGFRPADSQYYQFGKMCRTESQSETYPLEDLRLFTMMYRIKVVDISRTIQNIEDLFPAQVDFEDEIDSVEEGMPLADGN